MPNIAERAGRPGLQLRGHDPTINLLGYQPVVRLDYQPTRNLRGSFKFSSISSRTMSFPASLPGLQRHAGGRLRHLDAWPAIGQLDGQLRRRSSRPSFGANYSPPGRLLGRPADRRTSAAARLPVNDDRQPQQRRVRRDSVSLPGRHGPRSGHVRRTRSCSRSGHADLGRHARAGGAAFTWGNRVANAPPNIQRPVQQLHPRHARLELQRQPDAGRRAATR